MNKRKCVKSQLEMQQTNNMQIKNLYNTNGITLIALVISIIVMLILAGVSLNATIGENGVLSQAKNAKIAQEDAVWDEDAQTILTAALMGKDDIEALTEEQKVEAGNDADKIEDFKRENMRNYLQARFQEKSNNSVIVSRYAEGYLIVDGERVFIVGKDFDKYMNAKSQRLLVANDEEWTFKEISEGTCSITAYNKELKGTISIPAVLISKENEKAYVVEELGNDVFNYGTQIKKVDFSKVGNILKRIGDRTFMNCTSLVINVPEDLPSSLEYIGYKAFYNCKSLTGNIDAIQNSGVTLGQGVFMNCSGLTGSMQSVFNQSFYIETDGNPSATVIEEGQFSGFSGLTGSLTIPYYITEIKKNAFYGCTGIDALNFEEGETGSQLVTIGDSAFQECTGIKNKLVIPSKVKSIGNSCFNNSQINGIEFNSIIKNVGNGAFMSCSNVFGKVVIPSTIERIEANTFRSCTNIEEVYWENNDNIGCKTIGVLSFYNCPRLTKITLPATLEEIQERAFDGAKITNEVYLPNSLKKIQRQAFIQQNKMNVTNWPQNLEEIGEQAFIGCEAIQTLPSTAKLSKLGKEAFKDCTNLGKTDTNEKTDVIKWLSNSKIATIGENCFENDTYLTGEFSGTINNLNKQKIAISGSIFTNTGITRVSDITSIGNVIADNQYSGSTKFLSKGEEVTEITIPNGVTSIGKNAFAGCTSITKVIIPNTVTSISQGAFMNCTNLTTIEFETGINIKLIPDFFCYNNVKFVSIVLPNTITEIGTYAFYGAGLGNIEIPSSVVKIGNSAFENSSLQYVKLNDGLVSIGSGAFYNSKIESIIIPDSVTDTLNSYVARCKNLTSITLGKGIKVMKGYFIWGCPKLKEVIVKGKITRIEEKAFSGDSELTLNGIKGLNWEDVLYIGDSAFYSCTALKGKVTVNKACVISENATIGSFIEFTK